MIPVETMLACALRSRRSFSVLRRAVVSDLAVADPFHLQIMRFVAAHVDEHGDLPKDGDFELWVEGMDTLKREALRSKWRALRRTDISGFTEANLAEAAAVTFREAAAKTAVHRLAAMAERGELSAASTIALAEEVQSIRPVHLDGLANVADVERYLAPPREEDVRVPSGIEKLDHVLGGGFERELVFLMAGTGGGKTTFLVNRLVAAATFGATCLHVTFELSTIKTLHRYYRRIADAERAEFFTDREAVDGRVRHWLRFATGAINVLYLPAYSATAQDVRATAEVFRDMTGGLDVLAVDYLDLLAPPKNAGRLPRHEQLGILSHELRTICTTMDAEVITASQANREGLDASKLSLKHMAGAISKAQAADVVLGLVQTEDEAAVRQARLGMLKMRDYPGRGAEIPLHFDMDRMTMLDLDHPSARQRRAKLEAEWQRRSQHPQE